jgi:hypothetical protein
MGLAARLSLLARKAALPLRLPSDGDAPPRYTKGEARPFSTSSGDRVYSLDDREVVAHGPVRRQPTGIHREDVELFPGDPDTTWWPAR